MPDSRPVSPACQTSMSDFLPDHTTMAWAHLRTWSAYLGQGYDGVPLFPSFAVPKLDNPWERDIRHADSGHFPDAQKAYLGKGCKSHKEGSVPGLRCVLHEDDKPSGWKVWLGPAEAAPAAILL